jgi:hypothetical protein
MDLRYLYVGCDDTETSLGVWAAVPGAVLLWRFQAFGADVGAIDLGSPPVVLIADHRPAGDVLPIYAVADLAAAVAELVAAGWQLVHGHLGTPEGPASVVRDPSGTAIALLRVDRPGAMEGSYADPANRRAVRPPTA